ncbi:unnamed protein product [Phaedon cochleariae]|uniref:Teneurin NHL domain-containing protein n=1 Tax=Phaedon cochleariae TaxID=80249 RepID=A0A9N9X2A8_PHACE|nr:unnamed protein product [Phaedon cochleariae]
MSVVGNGERCIPGDETLCGDGGPAKKARLAHPKGVAVAVDGTIYIADGTNLRAVDASGTIRTLVGDHGHRNRWTPIPCHGAVAASQGPTPSPSLNSSPTPSSCRRHRLHPTISTIVLLFTLVPGHCMSGP